MKKGDIKMKKLIITLFVLITSFTANAKEYNGNEVKYCSQNAIVMFCDLEGEPITGVVKSYYENGNLKAEVNFKDGKAVSGYMYDIDGEKKRNDKCSFTQYDEKSEITRFL